jgi:hypothetical protein
MRFIRYGVTTLTLAGTTALAVIAAPAAFAAGAGTVPGGAVIDVTPSTATPGSSVTFAVTCVAGPGTGAASATLYGTTLGLSEHIPMDASTHEGEFVTTVDLPSSISPGQYSPSIDCDNGMSGTAELTVIPNGVPVTGDGVTSSGAGGPLTLAGIALLGAGGLAAGTAAVLKRRNGGRSSSR